MISCRARFRIVETESQRGSYAARILVRHVVTPDFATLSFYDAGVYCQKAGAQIGLE